MKLKNNNYGKLKIRKSSLFKNTKNIKLLLFYYFFIFKQQFLKNILNYKINKKLFILKHNLINKKKKNKYYFYLKKNTNNKNNYISFFLDFDKKFIFLKKQFFANFYNILRFLIISSKQQKKEKTFYSKKIDKCGIVKTFLNFTNMFIILTNLKGEVKSWVSAGTGGFEKKRQRTTSRVPTALCSRISNMIPRKKFKYIKIKMAGPSKRFRSVVLQALEKKSWIRQHHIVCIEDFYAKAYNGCRLKREKRR